MAIHGLGTPTHLPPLAPRGREGANPAAGRMTRPPVLPPQASPVAQAATSLRAAQAAPSEPPPNTDPALWGILTADERAHFVRLGAMGPLTYGRMSSTPTPTFSRGARLDVRG